MSSENVLPAAAVQTLGTDAVVSLTPDLIGAKEWHDRQSGVRQDSVPRRDEPPVARSHDDPF
jgi:hypothetical protein